jgi:hypothetical protein
VEPNLTTARKPGPLQNCSTLAILSGIHRWLMSTSIPHCRAENAGSEIVVFAEGGSCLLAAARADSCARHQAVRRVCTLTNHIIFLIISSIQVKVLLFLRRRVHFMFVFFSMIF